MSLVESKYAILESVNEMDRLQAARVLDYIKSMLGKSDEAHYNRFKKKALREINEALKQA